MKTLSYSKKSSKKLTKGIDLAFIRLGIHKLPQIKESKQVKKSA